MKLVALCLLAVCSCALAMPTTRHPVKKLEETLSELTKLENNLTNTTGELNIPNNFVEFIKRRVKSQLEEADKHMQSADCGCLSALDCFHKGVQTLNSSNPKLVIKLQKSLVNNSTRIGLEFCDKDSTPSCSKCSTHKVSVDQFLSQLKTLLQKGITKHSMG